MQIAILESDLRALDRALELLSSAGHLCFGALTDKSLQEVLEQVSLDLIILDWSAPDAARYDTLRYLAKYRPITPIVLCVTSSTSNDAIVSGLNSGANICLEKPLSCGKSLTHIHALGRNSNSYATSVVS
ncbi:response regulator [Paraburkholderia phenazinium]|jgi:DNA-binding response OmpR family regulator|uniref:Response regulator receiver domain-containing protein n=1 Tax=Paraburkholderia phenazinium TaxID=60549 RepID=A0A1G7S5G2_9BURK|nr:response regulator [Paraburkholderia phenazinium]SDG18265.1 Response regulator receiver domain-containing protein [Paraburkholderia phenazinium]